jgi:hypothetical protein
MTKRTLVRTDLRSDQDGTHGNKNTTVAGPRGEKRSREVFNEDEGGEDSRFISHSGPEKRATLSIASPVSLNSVDIVILGEKL